MADIAQVPTAQEGFAADLEAYGARPRWEFNYVMEGPFLFGGVITDSATTAADLTLIASMLDPRIRDLYKLNQPKLIYHIEAVEFFIENTGLVDTEGLMADLFENVFIYHKDGQGKQQRLNVFPFGGTTMTRPSTSTTVNNTTVDRRDKIGRIFELPSPWNVNCESDTFDVEPYASVNTGANVPFQLVAHGLCWPAVHGVIPPRRCMDRKVGVEIRERRTRAAVERQLRNRDR